MSGGSGQRAALEETGMRLGEVLRRALADRLARRVGAQSDNAKRAGGEALQSDAERAAGPEGSRHGRGA